MERRIRIVSAVILMLFLFSGPAFAGGWGPYFSWAREEPSTGFPDDYLDALRDIGAPESVIREMEEASVGVSVDHLTFGVIYESAPARDKLLSYRGTLGFDIATSISVENVEIAGISIDMLGLDLDESSKYGLSTKHTLAFGIIRADGIKWWAGPGIGLSFNYYSKDRDILGTTFDLQAANLSIGGGGETGVNIHLGQGLTLCVGGGIHWRAFAYGGGSEDLGSLVWGDGPFFFVETSLLFRTGPDRG
jgi:hypothetical protein